MKVNDLSMSKVGKDMIVGFKIKSIVANPDGGIEVYGEAPNGSEVRLYSSAAASAALDVTVDDTV